MIPLPLLLEKRGWGGGRGEVVALAANVATGRGSVNGEYLGRGMPCGTTNPRK